MLKINKKRSLGAGKALLSFVAIALVLSGAYMLSLVAAPTVAPALVTKPIAVSSLPAPKITENRVVIPKIGVNIPYGTDGKSSLDKGAEWRFPERGDPEKGGNFIIAAHRFSIQPTPMGTIEKSPFYNIDKLVTGDKIVIDYSGMRYGYEITELSTVKATQVEIESPSPTAKLTLYSCELGGSKAGRVVVTAKPLGKVALVSDPSVH